MRTSTLSGRVIVPAERRAETVFEGRTNGRKLWKKTIHGDSEGILKLVSIVPYCEASVDGATPSNDVINGVTVSKDVVKNARKIPYPGVQTGIVVELFPFYNP
ncbi:hypothetical protein PAXINDRAFT_15879 [Paxillus involutus ATCC 200175]|uniref:Uncharacterized protein n=1 Tax=Paxillus involutus ATCC 200175 TaxID=664439 RepID=A0A0C9TKQ8_PAXIN|nr:hypothetical protein PAXINDRAFT_15879 [Paxillus involutus ATCC 200175]